MKNAGTLENFAIAPEFPVHTPRFTLARLGQRAKGVHNWVQIVIMQSYKSATQRFRVCTNLRIFRTHRNSSSIIHDLICILLRCRRADLFNGSDICLSRWLHQRIGEGFTEPADLPVRRRVLYDDSGRIAICSDGNSARPNVQLSARGSSRLTGIHTRTAFGLRDHDWLFRSHPCSGNLFFT